MAETSARKGKPVKKAPRSSQGATRQVAKAQMPRRNLVWLNRLLIILGVGVVAAAGMNGFIKLQAIPVQRIAVTGTLEHTQKVALQELVQPALVGGFLNADLGRIRDQLEALPWVYEASVRRRWPSALEIHVMEQLPIARWGEEGFLNHEGEIFRPHRAGEWAQLPVLTGTEGSARQLMDSYQQLVEMLAPVGLSVAALTMDERGQLRTVLAGGTELIMGGEALEERLERFIALYQTELSGRMDTVERVDMRYASGLAVAFGESTAVAGL